MNPWNFNSSPLTKPPDNAFGFVYQIISHVAGNKLYIGSKQFYSYTSKKRKHTVKDSDWKTYYGSCKALTADIELYGKDLFTREVLRICYNRFELTYYEAKYQFDQDVLLKPDQYYNGNILRAVFTPK